MANAFTPDFGTGTGGSLTGGTSGSWFPGLTKTEQNAARARALMAAHPPGHHSAIGGFLSHILGDVVSTAKGLPMGVETALTQNPLTTIGQIADQEKATWSPLLTGDFNKFVHNFYEHPLGPLLDAASVLTLGGAASARLANLGVDLGAIDKASALGKIGQTSERAVRAGDLSTVDTELKTITKDGEQGINVGRYHYNPVIRARQKIFDQASQLMPSRTPLFGESARATRAIVKLSDSKAAANSAIVDSYIKSIHRLKGNTSLWTAHMALLDGARPSEIFADQEGHILRHNAASEEATAQLDKLQADLQKRIDAHHLGAPQPGRVLEKMQKQMDALQQARDEVTKHEIDPLNKQALLDPKANDYYDQAIAAHKLAKRLGYEPEDHLIHNANVQPGIDAAQQALDHAAGVLEKHRAQFRVGAPPIQGITRYNSTTGLMETVKPTRASLRATGVMHKGALDQATAELARQKGLLRTSTSVNKRLGQVIGDKSMSGISKEARALLVSRDAAKNLSEADTAIRKVDAVRAERRRWLHPAMRAGADFMPDRIVRLHGASNLGNVIEKEDGTIDEVATKVAQKMAKGRDRFKGGELGELQDDGSVKLLRNRGTSKKALKVEPADYVKLDGKEAEDAINKAFPMHAPEVSRELWHPDGIDKVVAKMKLEHLAKGLPEPVYMPDKMAMHEPSGVGGAQKFTKKYGSDKGEVNIKNYQNQGVLYKAGVINHDPMLLAKQSMMDFAVAHAADNAALLRKYSSVHIGHSIPKGFVALTKMATDRDYLNQTLPQFKEEMAKHFANIDVNKAASDSNKTFLDAHVTENAGEVGEHKLIVHKDLVDALSTEYKKSSRFMHAFFQRPQQVWKHMVLAGRPIPFVANNVIGNSIMYALRHSGPAGILGLIGARHEERAFEELFAGHHLTFGGMHKLDRPTGLKKVLNRPYEIVSAHEHLLRRASMKASAHAMPEVRQAMKELRAGGYDAAKNENKTLFHAALEKAEEDHHGVINQIGEHIDDTMGDYRKFSKTERGLQSAIPFYSWDRHAARAYYRLLTDKPLTAALTTRLGQMGSAQTDKLLGNVPDYMKEYIPAGILKSIGLGGGKGRSNMINASVLNPESTVASLVKTAEAFASGKPGSAPADLTSQFSPFITGLIQAATGKSLLTGAPVKTNFLSGFGALGQTLGDTAVNLPQARLLETLIPAGTQGSAAPDTSTDQYKYSPTGKLRVHHTPVTDSSFLTTLAKQLAIPAVHPNIAGAHRVKSNQDAVAAGGHFHVAAVPKRKKKVSTSLTGSGSGNI